MPCMFILESDSRFCSHCVIAYSLGSCNLFHSVGLIIEVPVSLFILLNPWLLLIGILLLFLLILLCYYLEKLAYKDYIVSIMGKLKAFLRHTILNKF